MAQPRTAARAEPVCRIGLPEPQKRELALSLFAAAAAPAAARRPASRGCAGAGGIAVGRRRCPADLSRWTLPRRGLARYARGRVARLDAAGDQGADGPGPRSIARRSWGRAD